MAKSSTRVIQCVVFEEAVELVCCRKQRTVCRKLRIGGRAFVSVFFVGAGKKTKPPMG